MNKQANILMGILITFGIGLILFGWIAGTYNGLVKVDANTQQKFGNVQTALQRQADLIPNLVNTVKGSVKFEQETQTAIASLRSGIKYAKTPGELDKFGAEMNSIVSGILISVEAYPDLKSSQNFLALQDELAGSVNRITYERNNYNEAVKEYQTKVRTFPANIVAGMFSFDTDKWETFKAQEGTENPPEVKF